MYPVLEAGAIFQYSKEYRSENCPKLENFQYELMANLPTIHCLKRSEGIWKLFGRVRHCFSHSTVGSSKTRQITIRGRGLNTTNHDMRSIGLTTASCDTIGNRLHTNHNKPGWSEHVAELHDIAREHRLFQTPVSQSS